MNSTEFRKELMKIMPGYKWTVHTGIGLEGFLSATGIQSAGFNRLSTLQVYRRDGDCRVEYEVKSSGFGKNSPWLSTYTDGTLARALRGLQNHYRYMASLYSNHEWSLQGARKPKHT